MLTILNGQRPMRLALVAALSAVAAACTTKDERGDIVLSKFVGPKANGASCSLEPGTAETAGLVADVNRTPFVRRGAIVENRLASNANPAVGRLNTNDFEAQTARIRVTFPDPGYAGATIERTVAVSGIAKAGSSQAVLVEILPNDVVAALKGKALPASGFGTVRVATRLEGNLLDGTTVQSTEYEYVLNVCQGCLVLPPCTASSDGGTPTTTPTVSCSPGTNDDTATCQ